MYAYASVVRAAASRESLVFPRQGCAKFRVRPLTNSSLDSLGFIRTDATLARSSQLAATNQQVRVAFGAAELFRRLLAAQSLGSGAHAVRQPLELVAQSATRRTSDRNQSWTRTTLSDQSKKHENRIADRRRHDAVPEGIPVFGQTVQPSPRGIGNLVSLVV